MEKKIINRRNFLGSSLAADATITVGGSFATEQGIKPAPVKKNDEHPFNERTYGAMPTHSFGKTGYKVGILSLGGQATLEMLGIVGMKVVTRGRMLSTWTPPPIADQPVRMATLKPGTITIQEALQYNMSLPVSTTIIGIDNVAQIEEDVKIASEFSPLNEEQMKEIEYKTLPIVRQGLYFRRWELGV